MGNLDAAKKVLDSVRGSATGALMLRIICAYDSEQEPKELPKPEHRCGTCRHRGRLMQQPCNHCLEPYQDGRHPMWQPKESKPAKQQSGKPAQEYKLEAGCRVMERGCEGLTGEVIYVSGGGVIVVWNDDMQGFLGVDDIIVIEPATPEAEDYVLAKGACGETLGTIDDIDPDDRLAYQVRLAWYSRGDITIRAKGRRYD